MTHRSDVWPKVLSGGEAQRVSLARALVREPDLLLLDEPFSALDALTRLTAQALVADLWALHQCAVLLVTHDVEESVKLADRVLVMKDGVIAHEATGGSSPTTRCDRSEVRCAPRGTPRSSRRGSALMTLTTSPLPATATPRSRAQQWLLTRLRQVLDRAEISLLTADLESYATDRSGHRLPGSALAVLRPSTTAAVQAILRVAEAAGVTVVPRGAGTGLSGGASVPDGALVLSTERLNSIVRIDPENEIAVVQAGVITADVDAAAAEFGLMYAPDPASHQISTIGGNIATNAGGLRCVEIRCHQGVHPRVDRRAGRRFVAADRPADDQGRRRLRPHRAVRRRGGHAGCRGRGDLRFGRGRSGPEQRWRSFPRSPQPPPV